LGFRVFNENKENKILLTTNKSINIIEEYNPYNLKKQTKKLIQIDEIDKLLTFKEILEYSIDIIKLKNNYLLNRISELKDL
jgi:hypothetical protein